MTTDRIVVTQSTERWIEDLPVEIVERKGIGHPDSLCDGMAEQISVAYTRWCQEHLGAPLHHNFDKVQLVAGEVDVGFGYGRLLRPIRVQIAGRGTSVSPSGLAVPMDVIAIEAAKDYLRQAMRYLNPDRHCVIDCYAGRGDNQLIQTVERVTANDTSFGVAHWPLSTLEQLVYDTAQYLNYELLHLYPIGEDIKVMGARIRDAATLTCAIPFMAREIPDMASYRWVKAAVRDAVAQFAAERVNLPVTVSLNTADESAGGGAYLTVTGTSAEGGDDGSVGRGNRVTGLITPFRPVSLEAVAGKNPISHVGKLYNVLALTAAQTIIEEVAGIRQVEIVLLSQIGQPLEEPQVVSAAVYPAGGHLDGQQQDAVRAVIEAALANIDEIRRRILAGEAPIF
jgi:S-adenosylmethionine synthetase